MVVNGPMFDNTNEVPEIMMVDVFDIVVDVMVLAMQIVEGGGTGVSGGHV